MKKIRRSLLDLCIIAMHFSSRRDDAVSWPRWNRTVEEERAERQKRRLFSFSFLFLFSFFGFSIVTI